MIKTYLFSVILLLSNVLIAQNEHIIGISNNIKKVPFAIVEKPPIAPHCNENLESKSLKICTSAFIQEYIQINLTRQDFSNIDISNYDTINVEFVINKEGNVENIQINSSDQSLKKHLSKIVQALPKFKPGKQTGKIVDVLYVLPISFKSFK
jgi:protein TonB